MSSSMSSPMSWLAAVIDDIDRDGAVVRVTVVRADGSTPRETGAAMLVAASAVRGTIGGGALELAAIEHARKLLPAAFVAGAERRSGQPRWSRDVRHFPLGPALGQCCGGHARLLFEVFGAGEHQHLASLLDGCEAARGLVLRALDSGTPPYVTADRKEHRPEWPLPVTRAVRDMLSGARPRSPLLVGGGKGQPAWFIEPLARTTYRLYVYGAGHVGRAIVRVLQDLPFAIAWVDTLPGRFPEPMPAHAEAEVAPDPARFAAAAEADAFHLVLTYSHALDLAICHNILRRGDFRFLGLIGSATKRARFAKRLTGLGIGQDCLARLTCPIGVPGIGGKEPATIALSVAAQLVQLVTADASRGQTPRATVGNSASPCARGG